MSNSDEQLREIDRLRDRMSRLSAASLRINASLDLDTVLGEVVEGARVLTSSHYGLITTVDDSGHPRGQVSSGRLAVDITTGSRSGPPGSGPGAGGSPLGSGAGAHAAEISRTPFGSLR